MPEDDLSRNSPPSSGGHRTISSALRAGDQEARMHRAAAQSDEPSQLELHRTSITEWRRDGLYDLHLEYTRQHMSRNGKMRSICSARRGRTGAAPQAGTVQHVRQRVQSMDAAEA